MRPDWLRPHRYADRPTDDYPWGTVIVFVLTCLVLGGLVAILTH